MTEIQPSKLTPVNLAQERQKFFESDTYNPQFIYKQEVDFSRLTIWGNSQPAVFEHADRMLKTLLVDPLKSSADITEEVVRQRIQKFNDEYKLDKPIQVKFSETQLSKCSFHEDVVSFRVPLKMDDEKLEALIRHELETHALRFRNHQIQPWKEYVSPAPGFRRTEEGLATLHTVLFRQNQSMRKSFLSYAAATIAETSSFREVYDYLRSVGCPKNTSWKVTVRVKRGYSDTSLPGAFTRELCYLEGTLQVWQALTSKRVSVEDLYLGRISIEDVATLGAEANREATKVPEFASGQNESSYFEELQKIGELNKFSSVSTM